MTSLPFPTRAQIYDIVAVWGVAFLGTIAVAIFVPETERAAWMVAAFAGCIVIAFAIQLWRGVAEGFVLRIAASIVGALLAVGLVAGVVGLFSLATLFEV